MKLSNVLISLGTAVAIFVGQGCNLFAGEVTKEEKLCVPGAFVFCRCADRAEGTKLCKDDGQSFDKCQTSDEGECVGGEVRDDRTGNPVEPPPTPTKPDGSNAVNECPGQPQAIEPNKDVVITGDTSTATGDRKGKPGVCAQGTGAKDHVWHLTPGGSGQLKVSVTGKDGFKPIAYLRSVCDAEDKQLDCGVPQSAAPAAFDYNVTPRGQYFLFIDGSSGATGKYTVTMRLTPMPFCGDGKVDPDEACDDENKDPNESDGCSNSCQQVSGNPTSATKCDGQPVDVWTGKTVIGFASTTGLANAWGNPSTACSATGTNTTPDHVYGVTPHKDGNLKVTLFAAPNTTLPNLMLSARAVCGTASSMIANACQANATGPETITFPVKDGKKVFVAVDGGVGTPNEGEYGIKFEFVQ